MDHPPVVDVNSAGPEQLQQLVGVGRAEADAILAHRQLLPGGSFQCIHDLKGVVGLREDFLELNQGRLACSPPVPVCCSSCSASSLPAAAAAPASSLDTSKDSNCQHTASSVASTPLLNHCCGQRSSSDPGPGVSSAKVSPLPTSSASHQTSHTSARECEINSIASSVRKLLRGSTDSCQCFKGCLDCGAGSGELSDCGSDMDSSSEEECMEDEEEEDCETILASADDAAATAMLASTDKPLMKRKSDMVVDNKVETNPGKKPCRTLEVFGQTVQAPPADVSLDSGIAEGEAQESSADTTLSQSVRSPVPPSPCTPAAALVEVERRLAAKVVQPPQNLDQWLAMFQTWSNAERLLALDQLMEVCEPRQIRHVMGVIEPQFQRDFISLLPKELALYVLDFLEPRDLLRAAQTCRSWRILAEDNLLWREKCREAGIDDIKEVLGKRRLRNALLSLSGCPSPGDGTGLPSSQHHHHNSNSASTENIVHPSPWKAAYMTHHKIEMNWRHKPIHMPKVLKGHDDHVITCLQFSGNRVVSGSDDNTLKVWSATTGKCLRTLVGHTGGVWTSQMSGNIIISGSTDRTLKVWDADTGNCIHTLYGHTSTVRCMHLHGSRVVSGSRDASLRLWDIETGQCLHVLIGHVAAVRCVQYNGHLVVSGAYDYMVKVWNPEREECLHTLQGHTNRVYSLQFDGVHVVSGSLDTSIRVWDVETGACKHMLMGHQSLTSGMELRNNILVSGNADSTVKVWDIINGQCLQTLAGPNKHQSAVTCLQFNNKFVITSSDDGTVKLWDLRTGDFLRNLVSLESGGSGGVVWRIRASATKLVCAVGSRNGTEETKLVVLDFDIDPK